MSPARLHHADLGSGEMMDGAQQKVFRRDEVGVKDSDELAFRRLHAFRQRTRLEAFPGAAMVMRNRKSESGVMFDQATGDGHGCVGRIVQHLNVELLERIVQAANGVQQPFNHKLLVENRKLNGYARQIGKLAWRIGRAKPFSFRFSTSSLWLNGCWTPFAA